MKTGPNAIFEPITGDYGPVSIAAQYAGSRGGIAPAHLLDVQTPAGDVFHWSDRDLRNIPGAILSDAETATGLVHYKRWLMDVGSFSFYRSLQTDTGTLKVQNASGDILQSDFERIIRRTTLEGSLFVYRYYDVALQYAWIEQHGTLTVGDTPRFSNATLSLSQLNQGQDDTPSESIVETCQLNWGEGRCGATGDTECLYTFASCQVVEHFKAIQTAFEINNPEAVAQLPQRPVNRARPW